MREGSFGRPAVLGATANILALALAGMIALPAEAGTGKEKGPRKNPFVHDDPKWQISLVPSYALLTGYAGDRHRGGGSAVVVQYQLTTAFAMSIEASWYMFSRVKGIEEASPTQAVKLRLMLRYDIDVVAWRPYLAAGAAAVLFPAGIMRQSETRPDGATPAVGSNWGPWIECGLEWRPIRWLVVGVVLDMGWLLRFSPVKGKTWPSMRSIGLRAGLYF